MFKQDLTFSTPYMNATGTLGFVPDYRAHVPWDGFGAFVTNPLSLQPRKVSRNPALIDYPGGFLLHTGLPNPGLKVAIKKYARRWADSRLPIIVHLMADHPDETRRMVQSLENLDNIIAVELGFAPLLSEEIILSTVELSLGELPLIICLPLEKVIHLGLHVIHLGAAAICLESPRGMVITKNGEKISGRMNGPGLLPQALLTVQEASARKLPIIAAGGVGSKDNADTMLASGALAAQLDISLWKGDVSAWVPIP